MGEGPGGGERGVAGSIRYVRYVTVVLVLHRFGGRWGRAHWDNAVAVVKKQSPGGIQPSECCTASSL